MPSRCWLVKQEPADYPWSQLVAEGGTAWTGVRNFQARNHLRAMQAGDAVLYYHSGAEKAVVGLARVARTAYPAPTAGEGDWVAVDLVPERPLPRPVTLAEIKAEAALRNLPLIRQSRLSVMPVMAAEFNHLLALADKAPPSARPGQVPFTPAIMTAPRLEHLGLPARDPAALKDWYVRVLDARVVWSQPGPPPGFFLALPGDGPWLEVYAAARALPDIADNALAGWRHVALRVGSLEAARDQLAARGVVFRDPVKPAGGGGRVLFFQDPEGNLLHLVERPAESPLATAPT